MKRSYGFIIIGLLCILASLILLYRNIAEDYNAKKASTLLSSELDEKIEISKAELKIDDKSAEENSPEINSTISGRENLESDKNTEGSKKKISKTKCKNTAWGKISIPKLDLMLPVFKDWNYRKLKCAPCIYSGSIATNDLSILGHNYKSHFGRLKKISQDDEVILYDLNGSEFHYRVSKIEIVAAEEVKKVTDGEFPLTLFTCTPGGQKRLTVYCELIDIK